MSVTFLVIFLYLVSLLYGMLMSSWMVVESSLIPNSSSEDIQYCEYAYTISEIRGDHHLLLPVCAIPCYLIPVWLS